MIIYHKIGLVLFSEADECAFNKAFYHCFVKVCSYAFYINTSAFKPSFFHIMKKQSKLHLFSIHLFPI